MALHQLRGLPAYRELFVAHYQEQALLIEDFGQFYLASAYTSAEKARTLRPLQAAAFTLEATPGR